MSYDLSTVLCGVVIGCALGLTGGGGSIFAVPLLVYVLGVDVRTAVGVSLAAVGATSAFGIVTRLRSNEIDFRIGLIFAVSGMLSTPAGTWIGRQLPPSWILLAFAALMLLVAVGMWSKPDGGVASQAPGERNSEIPRGKRWLKLVGVGILVGLFTGVFGVGGGFIMVPALVLLGGVSIQRAVVTSLLVVTLVCVSGVASYLIGGETLPVALSSWFVLGGFSGMLIGGLWRQRLSGAGLKRTFAIAMGVVAIFVIGESLWKSGQAVEPPAFSRHS